MEKFIQCLLLFTVCLESIAAFYTALKAPVTYCIEGSTDCQHDIPLYANRLSSLESVITYEYDRFDFCKVDSDVPIYHANLGQILSGDRITRSPYKLQFKKDLICQEVCTRKYKAGVQADETLFNFTKDAIFLNYNQHWLADDVPIPWCYRTENADEYCSLSVPLGCYVTTDGKQKDACIMNSKFMKNNSFYVFNHLNLEVEYSPSKTEDGQLSAETGRVLAIKVLPDSYRWGCNGNPLSLPGGQLLEDIDITFTYSVKWIENQQTKWSSRWDYILEERNKQILAFSTVNSLVVLCFLGVFVTFILLTIHNKCMCRKTAVDFKWKALYPFVFHPPKHEMLLSVLCGSGLQIFLAALVTSFVACIGIVTLANPGSLVLCYLGSYAVMGAPAGYTAARFYKTFCGQQPILQTTLLSILCPGLSFLLFLIMDTVQRSVGSSSATPFSAHLTLFGFWFASAVFTFAGAYFGYRKGANHIPCKTDESEKLPEVPRKKVWQRLFCVMPCSILPAGVVHILMFFIMNSLWAEQVFTHWAFLLVSLTLLALTSMGLAMIITYFHLNAKDFRWWWRAYLTLSFTGVFFFLYFTYYFFQKSEFEDGVSVIVYFGYSLLISFLVFLACGAVGFIGSFVFVVRIYTVVQKNLEEEGDYDPAETLM